MKKELLKTKESFVTLLSCRTKRVTTIMTVLAVNITTMALFNKQADPVVITEYKQPDPVVMIAHTEPVIPQFEIDIIPEEETIELKLTFEAVSLDIQLEEFNEPMEVVPVREPNMELYNAGVKHWEGFKSKPYYCSGVAKTIGYGFTGDEIKGRTYISRKVADKELVNEVLPKYAKQVDSIVKVPLTKHQRLALISFTYNLGQGNLRKLVNGSGRLNDGNYESVPEIMSRYVIAGGKKRDGLVLRRQWEVDVWHGDIHTNYGN